MNKFVFLRVVIIILLVAAVLLCLSFIFPKKQFDFSAIIGNESIKNITLTIYYTNPKLLTDIPISVEDLIILNDTNKIVVDGEELEKHIKLFYQISNDTVESVKKNSSYLDARLYYVLESKKNGKLFDVAMWGGDGEINSMFVNGIEVKEAPILYDVIMPFLPQNTAKKWDEFARTQKDKGKGQEDGSVVLIKEDKGT